MSALLSETRLPINKLASELDVHVSTVWRWTLRGVRGHRLERLIVGGRTYTTREAFERFVAATNGQKLPAGRTPRQRLADQRRAEAALDAMGI